MGKTSGSVRAPSRKLKEQEEELKILRRLRMQVASLIEDTEERGPVSRGEFWVPKQRIDDVSAVLDEWDNFNGSYEHG